MTFALNGLAQISFMNSLTLNPANLTPEQTTIYNQLINNQNYEAFYFVSSTNLSSALNGDELILYLPFLHSSSIYYKASTFTFKSDSNYTWTGKFEDSSSIGFSLKYSEIAILKVNNKLIGHITLDNLSYEIFDLTGGIHLICKSDLSIPESNYSCGATDAGNNNSENPGEKPGDNPCNNLTTRLLVLYTNATQAINSDIAGLANLIVAQNNQFWANSMVSNKLFLAGIERISFTQSSINNPPGNAFPPTFDVMALSNMTNVQALKNQHRADIVLLLVPSTWVFGGNTFFGVSREINTLNPNKSYVISEITSATNGRFTGTHEICHLYGGRHDDDTTDPLAKGYIFQTNCNIFGSNCITRRTLMAYVNAGVSRIQNISNPNINFNQKPTGDATHNNASQVNSRLISIANFVPDPFPSHATMLITTQGFNQNCQFRFNITICNDPDLFTYEWYNSNNGVSWFQIGMSPPPFYFPSSIAPRYYKCVVKQNGQIVYILQTNGAIAKSSVGCKLLGNNFVVAPHLGNFSEPQLPPSDPQKALIETGVSINSDISNSNILIFPNPNNGNFDLTTNLNIFDITIYDMLSKKIFHDHVEKKHSNVTLNLSTNLKSGIYILKLSKDNLVIQKKLIIQ